MVSKTSYNTSTLACLRPCLINVSTVYATATDNIQYFGLRVESVFEQVESLEGQLESFEPCQVNHENKLQLKLREQKQFFGS